MIGQTWTKQLRCRDPSCLIDHTSGEQHEWALQQNDDKNDDDKDDDVDDNELNDDTKVEVYQGPADRIVYPLDVLNPSPPDDEDLIYIVGTRGEKVTRIAGLEPYSKTLEELVLRSNLISHMNGVETLTKLTKLELYDNQVEAISHIENLTKLTILDLSFNCIRDMAPVSSCPLLQELYLAQNKLKCIDGIRGMQHLRCLDLGANRIRTMAGVGLDTLHSLQSLWLGKNKLERICDVQDLPVLRQLDCQNNRLTALVWPTIVPPVSDDAPDITSSPASDEDIDSSGIGRLKSLEELYLACNAIVRLDGLPVNSPLRTLDLSTNGVESVEGIEGLVELEELWMTASAMSTFEQLQPLTTLPKIECLYLEHSPIAADFEYRKKITALIPTLEQLDATQVNRL
jgi:protein phosphatase 1 regulatory subunit 7